MKLLAIDTTEEACSAALWIDGSIEEQFEIVPRRHSEHILPMMNAVLAISGVSLKDLDALAYARGPGSFTGVRIAASIIQGAAFGADLPVVPVSSLQALAQGANRAFGADAVLSAFDARMSEVYWGAYRCDNVGIMRLHGDEAVCPPGDVVVPEGGAWFGAGSGWGAYAEALNERSGVAEFNSELLVHAADVARIAVTLFDEGAAVAAEHAVPVYLRDQVAWAKSR